MDSSPSIVAVGLASAVVLSVGVAFFLYKQSSSKSSTTKVGPVKQLKKETSRTSLEHADKPRARILYGTQTGTAERFSKQLASDLRSKYGESMIVEVLDLENYHPEEQMQREKLVVLCIATYGDGEPTDNAADFFTWLGKEAQAVESGEKQAPLQGVSYAVFGLGNKQYEHFNAMGKKAFTALGQLGAHPVVRRGDGDDDGCIDDDFEKWSGELYTALEAKSSLVGVALTGNDVKPVESLPSYSVEVLPGGAAEDPAFPLGGSGQGHHSPYWATITAAKELHSTASDRSCVHVEIDISGSSATYETGDHVAVHAANNESIVEEVAGLLGLQLNQIVRLGLPADAKAKGVNAPPVGALSVRALLAWHTDLLATPHKDALNALAASASDPDQAKRLLHLASPEGKQEYAEHVAKKQRSLLEVLREFSSCKPPLGVFLAAVAPRLQPRFYSISSSSSLHPSSVHVTCAVVRDVMPTGRVHEGVASTWLQKQMGGRVGGKVPVYLRASHFKLPKDMSKPVVMIGPGTGLAPFRGFLQERAHLAHKYGADALGPAVLFFGCRSRAQDYIYEQELSEYLSSPALTELHVAFSRDGAAKDYVQHHLERQAEAVWKLLGTQGGYLYVCGDAKHMAKDVHRTLVGIVQQSKGVSGTQAEAWVKELQDTGRYQRDVW